MQLPHRKAPGESVRALRGGREAVLGARTDLAGGHHVLVLGVLVHCQAQDVISVLQVEALAT